MTKHEEILSKMTAEQKLLSTFDLIDSARELKKAYLIQEHPQWTSEQINQAVIKAFSDAS